MLSFCCCTNENGLAKLEMEEDSRKMIVPVQESSAPQTRSFLFEVRKMSTYEKIGLDLKHRLRGSRTELEIFAIQPDGAVMRTNLSNQAKSPPGETAKMGDIIVQVNEVSGNDFMMLDECSRCAKVTFVISRASDLGGLEECTL